MLPVSDCILTDRLVARPNPQLPSAVFTHVVSSLPSHVRSFSFWTPPLCVQVYHPPRRFAILYSLSVRNVSTFQSSFINIFSSVAKVWDREKHVKGSFSRQLSVGVIMVPNLSHIPCNWPMYRGHSLKITLDVSRPNTTPWRCLSPRHMSSRSFTDPLKILVEVNSYGKSFACSSISAPSRLEVSPRLKC